MTFEEYVALWAEQQRLKNLQSQYERNSPVILSSVQRKMTDEELTQLEKTLANVLSSRDHDLMRISQIASQYNGDYEEPINYLYNTNPTYKDIADNLWRSYVDEQILKDDLKSGYICTGSNCTYNATVDLPHAATYSADIVTNPAKYGLQLIDASDIQPGDLRVLFDDNGKPYHTVTYAGNGRYNWSNGHVSEDSWVTMGEDPSINKMKTNTYRFVGTDDDKASLYEKFLNGVKIEHITLTPIERRRKRINRDYMSESDEWADNMLNRVSEEGLVNAMMKKIPQKVAYITMEKQGGVLNYLNLFK